MNPDLTALAAYGGAYERKLFSTLILGLDAAKDMTLIPNLKNKITLTKLTVGDGVRPYTATFDPPANDLAYSGRELDVNLFKRDIQIEPLKYTSTWMAEVLAAGTDTKEIPFAAYVWNQVIATINKEINNAVYLGVYNPAGNNAAAIVTGLGTIIANEITAGKLAPVTLGAISETNAVSKFETLHETMPIPYQKNGYNIYCSFASAKKYIKDYRERYGKYTTRNTNGFYTIDDSGELAQIYPVTWMGNSSRLIATPKENLLLGTDLLSDLNKINTKENIYTVDAGIVGKIGVQIRDLEAMRVSEAA